MGEENWPEGPNPQTFVDISINPSVRDRLEIDCADASLDNKMQEFACLQKQIQQGLYDGDGPDDVTEVSQA